MGRFAAQQPIPDPARAPVTVGVAVAAVMVVAASKAAAPKTKTRGARRTRRCAGVSGSRAVGWGEQSPAAARKHTHKVN